MAPATTYRDERGQVPTNIFLISPDNALTELSQSPYESEDLLQRLVADHPKMLGSALGADGALLLIQREYAVPDSSDGASRWSLDHLFLDRDGVPVLVEIKRASDTRARREVVAQMLDYAANGVAYWPVEGIVEAFKAECGQRGVDPDSELVNFLGTAEPEAYWKAVEANLRSGRIRMVFLADQVSKELRRIVEFLNEQMRPAEVLAVEVIQYAHPNGTRSLVPTLLGATERAQSAKSPTTARPPMDEADWLQSLRDGKGEGAVSATQKFVGWLRGRGYHVGITESQDSLFASRTLPSGKTVYPIFIRRSTGNLEISLAYLRSAPAFATDSARLKLLADLKQALPGANIQSQKATGWPSIRLPLLLDDALWEPLKDLLEVVGARLADGAPYDEVAAQ